MFKINRKKEDKTPLTEEAEKAILSELTDATTAGEVGQAKSYAEIYSTLKSNDTKPEKEGMSDTVKVALISAGTSLLGILAVIRHEELNVIASKAMGLVTKTRI